MIRIIVGISLIFHGHSVICNAGTASDGTNIMTAETSKITMLNNNEASILEHNHRQPLHKDQNVAQYKDSQSTAFHRIPFGILQNGRIFNILAFFCSQTVASVVTLLMIAASISEPEDLETTVNLQESLQQPSEIESTEEMEQPQNIKPERTPFWLQSKCEEPSVTTPLSEPRTLEPTQEISNNKINKPKMLKEEKNEFWRTNWPNSHLDVSVDPDIEILQSDDSSQMKEKLNILDRRIREKLPLFEDIKKIEKDQSSTLAELFPAIYPNPPKNERQNRLLFGTPELIRNEIIHKLAKTQKLEDEIDDKLGLAAKEIPKVVNRVKAPNHQSQKDQWKSVVDIMNQIQRQLDPNIEHTIDDFVDNESVGVKELPEKFLEVIESWRSKISDRRKTIDQEMMKDVTFVDGYLERQSKLECKDPDVAELMGRYASLIEWKNEHIQKFRKALPYLDRESSLGYNQLELTYCLASQKINGIPETDESFPGIAKEAMRIGSMFNVLLDAHQTALTFYRKRCEADTISSKLLQHMKIDLGSECLGASDITPVQDFLSSLGRIRAQMSKLKYLDQVGDDLQKFQDSLQLLTKPNKEE